MLRTETVDQGTLECLKTLMQDERLNDFFLVGGTALSLQIGHRISVDLDLFSDKPFDAGKMLEYLESSSQFRLSFQDKNTLKGKMDGIRVDLITHAYPFVKPLNVVEGIRLAILEDIAAMKLDVIAGSGIRSKDVIDIATLSCNLSLKQMIDAYVLKYTGRNLITVLKSLDYFEDVNKEEHVKLVNKTYSWNNTEQRIKEMLQHTGEIFKSSPYTLVNKRRQ